MALPGSGVISFNDVRTEMSQSAKSPYNMSGWVAGPNSGNIGAGVATYTPINILSSGSRWSLTNRLAKSNLSMSAWYGYDRTLSIPLNVTGTLYNHASSASSFDYQGSSTMLILDAGTSNATYSINISGSYSSYDDDQKCHNMLIPPPSLSHYTKFKLLHPGLVNATSLALPCPYRTSSGCSGER